MHEDGGYPARAVELELKDILILSFIFWSQQSGKCVVQMQRVPCKIQVSHHSGNKKYI